MERCETCRWWNPPDGGWVTLCDSTARRENGTQVEYPKKDYGCPFHEPRPAPLTCGGCVGLDSTERPLFIEKRLIQKCKRRQRGGIFVSRGTPACDLFQAQAVCCMCARAIENLSWCEDHIEGSYCNQYRAKGTPACQHYKAKTAPTECEEAEKPEPDWKHKRYADSICLKCHAWKCWDEYDVDHRYCHPKDRKVPLGVGWECDLNPGKAKAPTECEEAESLCESCYWPRIIVTNEPDYQRWEQRAKWCNGYRDSCGKVLCCPHYDRKP